MQTTAEPKQKQIRLLSGHHLTARQKAIIRTLIDRKQFRGGTKLINMEITGIDTPGHYMVKIWERYALASRSFDMRAESQVVRWHHTQTVKIEVK